jgi:hypothetical protein
MTGWGGVVRQSRAFRDNRITVVQQNTKNDFYR